MSVIELYASVRSVSGACTLRFAELIDLNRCYFSRELRLVLHQNRGDYAFSESASVMSHNPTMDLDAASAYQGYGQEEGSDTGGVTTGFEALR